MLLGQAPLNAADLVSAISESFPLHATAADQTSFLRRALQRVGNSLGYQVVSPAWSSETSFVLAWWLPGSGTVLASICEWGKAGEVAAAFTQLMTIKAPMKLAIFRSREAGSERADVLLRNDAEAVLKAVGAAILDFSQHLEGELYLLLDYAQDEGEFRSYEFVVPADGKLTWESKQDRQLFRACEAPAAQSRG